MAADVDYTVIAFDPGGTTGWAVVQIADGVIGPPPFASWVESLGENMPSGEELEEAKLAYKAEQEDAAGYRISDNVNYWACGQLVGRADLQVDEMIELVCQWDSTSVVVMEDFILRQLRMDRSLLSPVHVTERFRHVLRDLGPAGTGWRASGARPRDVVLQPPSIGKGMMTDDRLKLVLKGELIARTRSAPHARDAVRHAFAFLRREKDAREHGRTLHVC